MSTFFKFALQTYRNSIGNVNAPGYHNWYNAAERGVAPNTAWTMISTIWSFWIFNQFLMVMILLNFVNATFGSSNEYAITHKLSHRYEFRAYMN